MQLLDAELGVSSGSATVDEFKEEGRGEERDAPRSRGSASIDHVAAVRERLKGRFRELLHNSNSLKIRSQVLGGGNNDRHHLTRSAPDRTYSPPD